jgi:Fe2+ or Zn2+ uptake regulation protein
VIVVTNYKLSLRAVSRKSKQKQAILGVIKGTRSHPSAGWIYEQVKKEIPNISLGTIYRNLRLLEKDGEILELETSNQGRFDGITRDHYHFKCDRCGRIFDMDMPVDEAMNERAARETGFDVFRHRLEFSGLCKDCARIYNGMRQSDASIEKLGR